MYKAIEMLMVEDNPGDIRLTQEAFKEYKVSNHLSVVKDDMEALCFLRCQGQYAHAILPDIILISIRTVWEHNAELLKQIKGDVTLVQIPVVLLTAFEGEEVILADDLPISLCVPKSLIFDCLASIVSLGGFGVVIMKPKAKLVPSRDRRRLAMREIKRAFPFQHILNSKWQLQNWENEGGKYRVAER